jgi:gamma-glutamyltranspeptidase/glutathione hydrolase
VTNYTGFTTRPELAGSSGMVAASHWLAAQSGMAMLEQGGNAFDAAVAAGLVLQVVEPHQCGPGGEAPMIVYSTLEDEAFVVDGQGPAPQAATIEKFKELGLTLVPGSGLLAACVPAALGSWLLVLERFGSMTLREVMAPAIGYAAEGFAGLASLTYVLRAIEPYVKENWPTTAELWLSGTGPRPGDRLKNLDLAATYERLLREAEAAGGGRERQIEAARRAVYEGFVAEAIDDFARLPVPDDSGVHAGLITGADMAGWRASVEEPARVAYRDCDVLKTAAWGQGPVFLQQLALLRGFDVSMFAAGSAELIHLVTECAKLAFADREAWYGDPRHVDVPLDELLSEPYNADRRQMIGDEANNEMRPGSPGDRRPLLPPYAVTDPRADVLASRDTCHVDVVDRHGNFVSATPSGGWLHSSPTVPGLGFCLGTRAQMFWLQEGLPDSLAPGKRPRTTLSPTLALRDGKPYMAFGTPGGDQQDQWTLRFFIYHIDLGYNLQAAVDAANWHSTHFPSSFHPRDARPGELVAETSLGQAVLDDLERRGHVVTPTPAWSIGRVTAVSRGADGLLRGAADARSQQAYVAGR